MTNRGIPVSEPVVQSIEILQAVQDAYGLDRMPESLRLSDVRGLLDGIAEGRFMAGHGQVIGDAVAATGNIEYDPYAGTFTADNGATSIPVDVNRPQAAQQQVFERICIRMNREFSATSYHWLEVVQVLEDASELRIFGQELVAVNLGYQADYPHYVCPSTPFVVPRGQTIYFRLFMQQNTTDVHIEWVGRQGFRVRPQWGIGNNTRMDVATHVG